MAFAYLIKRVHHRVHCLRQHGTASQFQMSSMHVYRATSQAQQAGKCLNQLEEFC